MARARTAIITRVDQMKVLASPVRQELLDVLSRAGSLSLADLGALVGRPADGLYYHVRLLRRAGLVRRVGTRARRGRREELVRAAARQFRMSYTPTSASRTGAMQAIVASMLRLGIRDFRRASANERNQFAGPARDVWALRTVGWLLPRHVRRVNRQIHGLMETATQTEPKGRLYAITVLLTPLDDRANLTGRRARRRSP